VNKKYFLPAVCAWLAAVATSSALDSVKTKSGSILCKIVGSSPLKVDVEQGANAERKEIPVNQIDTIYYSEEPASLKSAKNNILAGRDEEALNLLSRLKTDASSRRELREDIEFYTALASAHMAVEGAGNIVDAGRAMTAFIKNYPNSYHYFQACQVVGELFAANRSYAQAEEYYAKLAKAPWPDYRMRAGVAIGHALLENGKFPEALDAFEKVLANAADDPLSRAQNRAAVLGKAAVLVAMKKPDEATALANSFLNGADPEDSAGMARAYNVLGNALRQQGKTKEAILAFLHVDLLYPTPPDAHAEALYNLARLWDDLHKTDRAARAQQTLKQQYQNSHWAQKNE
jgi:tetratricopeptide (TPR) repeat protein